MPRKKLDPFIFWPTFALLGLGLLILFSISASSAKQICGNTHCFVSHQMLHGLLPGLGLGFLALKLDLKLLKKWAPMLFLITLILMSAVFIPQLGMTRGGARRWLNFGPLSFQPSEFLKITLPLYLASWLCGNKSWTKIFAKNKKRRENKSLVMLFFFFLILLPIIAIMVLQSDLGTLIVFLFIAFLIYFLAETPLWHSILIFLAGTAAVFLLILVAPYRMDRFLIFLNPEIDPLGKGYQLQQSLIAVGSGGIFGKGLGMSKQKLGILPNPMSDAVFAVFCEETGLLGAGTLLIFFLVLISQGLRVAKKAKDPFLFLLAASLSAQIALQAFLNFGALISLLPLTGIPLPLISYGGTHLVVELISIGILLNIARKI